jgi:hypothetical protein
MLSSKNTTIFLVSLVLCGIPMTVMDDGQAIGVNIGILLETKVTDGIYTWFLNGYSIVAPQRPPRWDCPLLAAQQILQG